MRNSSQRSNTDGMFVRRRRPQQQGRPSIDGMRVPSHFLKGAPASSNPTISTRRQHAADDSQNLPSNATNDEVDQVQFNNLVEDKSGAPMAKKPIDIDMTLDDENNIDQKPRRFWHKPSKRTVKRTIIALVVIALLVGGYMVYKILVASSHIFTGNVWSAVFGQEAQLKTDQYGRTNLLVFGTSESDPGHPGAQLTDSIMIVSIDRKANNAFLVSVPRDLWVKYNDPCTFGYEGKINAVFECTSNDGQDDAAGQKALANKVGQVFGVDFQYTVHLNLLVLKQAVDALGGIDITIDSPDPRGILDRNFDWRCNYKCYLVKYPNGPAHLDGERAMWLAQARNDAGGYGLPRSNFDREANQRKIVIAMKDKATSAGFLLNPVAVTNFFDSLGNNVHTNIDASEIKTFVTVAKNLDSKNIQSISIIDQTPAILTTGTGLDGSSIVKSVSGLYDYSPIQKFMKLQLSGLGSVSTEAAKVDVLNGSGVTGAATGLASKLENDAMTIGQIANASTITGKYQLYDLSGGKKPATLKQLLKDLGMSAPTGTTLPAGISSTASFVVIVGPDAAGGPSAATQ